MKKTGIAIGSSHKIEIRPDGRVVVNKDHRAIRAKQPTNKQIAARKGAASRVRVIKPVK